MRFGLKAILITSFLIFNSFFSIAYAEKIVIIAPSAVDIVQKLGAGGDVVGVTANIEEFPDALRLGTHISPNIERMAYLKPTLIVASSTFSAEMADRLGAELFIYEPKSLSDILVLTRSLSIKLGREAIGEDIVTELNALFSKIKIPENRPTVLYEVRSNPLAMAKNDSIIKDMLEVAGFQYAFPQASGMTSAEYIILNQPDYYIYQDGPMNMNPTPPKERRGWGGLKSCVWKVNQLEFSRANTQVFDTVLELNKILNSASPCEEGIKIYE